MTCHPIPRPYGSHPFGELVYLVATSLDPEFRTVWLNEWEQDWEWDLSVKSRVTGRPITILLEILKTYLTCLCLF